MLDNLQKFDIILGSSSPRRKELFSGLNIPYRVVVKDVDETIPKGMIGVGIPMFLAEKKANAFSDIMTDNTMLITADTIVLLEGEVLGKPKNRDDAGRMLRLLSGKTHQVITGVCISTLFRRRTFHTATEVKFAQFNPSEIDYYLDHFNPIDKAGSYGVQEWIGYIGVEQISGSYFNVMGLPVQRLYNELKRWL